MSGFLLKSYKKAKHEELIVLYKRCLLQAFAKVVQMG
jgi:hypothetical protein